MSRITSLILILMMVSCSLFRHHAKGTREVNGIIYLDESEFKKPEKPQKENSDRKAKKTKDVTRIQTAQKSEQLDGVLILVEDEGKAERPTETSTATPSVEASQTRETGQASYYANKFKGRPTASGEPYDPDKFTAAHRTLPFGTMVRVMNLENKKIVTVKINDRGPHVKERIIDLSYAAAEKLDLIRKGVAEVAIEVAK